MARKSIPPNKKSIGIMRAVKMMEPDVNEPGVCPVCGGEIKEKFIIKETSKTHSMKNDGLYCTKCGIRFEFIPPKDLK